MKLALTAVVFLGLALPVYNGVGNQLLETTSGSVNLPSIGGTYIFIAAVAGLVALLALVFL